MLLRYKEWDLFQNTLQISPKQLPLKPLHSSLGQGDEINGIERTWVIL
jgi:hypothetical protein